MSKIALTVERLRELLHYDPETGVFTWKVNRGHMARAGLVAGNLRSDGYRQIKVDGVLYRAHRLAWFHVTSKWPEGDLDHENLRKDDNRFDNLRPATDSQNKANVSANSNNRLGVKGVYFRGHLSRPFVASIQVNGRKRHLGCFETAEEAGAAYALAASSHFGEFARMH